MNNTQAIEYLTLKLQVNKLTGLLGEQNEVAELSIQALQENEQLKELLRLAENDVKSVCKFCVYQLASERCTECVGEHWQWQHADKLKGMIEG